MKLDKLAHRSISTVETTAGWVMPPTSEELKITLEIRNKGYISHLAIEQGLPRNSKGITFWNEDAKTARIIVPPLNTVEDLEIWRHEIRHTIEGHWH